MKCLCPLSGIIWKAEGFETGHKKLGIPHPIFSSPLSSLVAREVDWQAGRLSEEEKRLLFLAVLKNSSLVLWNYPANPSPETVEKNFLHLLSLTLWKSSILSPRLSLPLFHISRENSSLDNFHYWMKAWEGAKKEFEAGVSKQERLATKGRLEFYLEKRIHNVELGIVGESQKYLKVLASWAELATDFPTFSIQHPISGEAIKLNEYWKEIICCPEGKVFQYPPADIKEIEDHLIQEDNLEDLSTLYAGALVRRLRRLISRTTNLYGLELVELGEEETGFSFQTGQKRKWGERVAFDQKIDDALENIARTAPESEPVERDFQTKAQFLKAKIAWKISISRKHEQAQKSEGEEAE